MEAFQTGSQLVNRVEDRIESVEAVRWQLQGTQPKASDYDCHIQGVLSEKSCVASRDVYGPIVLVQAEGGLK